MARRLSERFDVFGQDTYTPLEEEHFASEMGQPSIVPREHHRPAVSERVIAAITRMRSEGLTDDEVGRTLGVSAHRIRSVMGEHRAAVLCQTPTTCGKCGRRTIPLEDTLVFVDGEVFHEGCVGPES